MTDRIELPYDDFVPSMATFAAVKQARRFNRIYGIYGALGIKDSWDKHTADVEVARRIVNGEIADLTFRTGSIRHRIAGIVSGEMEHLESTLDTKRVLADQLETFGKQNFAMYPDLANRPHHIRNGVNVIFSQDNERPIHPWRVIARRRAFKRYASSWRELIKQDRAKEPSRRRK